MPLQRLCKRLGFAVNGDGLVTLQPQQLNQLFHQRRIVLIPDTQRVARLIAQARVAEIDLDMAHVFFRIAAGDFLVHRQARRQRRLFGVRAGVDVVDGTRRGERGLRRRLFRHARFQHLNDARTPFGGGGLVFNIRVNAVQQALRAQLRQPAVEVFTGLAEEFIRGIAKAKYGKRRAIQLRRFFREQELMQGHRFFSRFTFTLRRGDHHQQFF